MVILHKQPLSEDMWVVRLQSVPSIQTLGSGGRCHVSISTSMGGEIVYGILDSNIRLNYMEKLVSRLDFDFYIIYLCKY